MHSFDHYFLETEAKRRHEEMLAFARQHRLARQAAPQPFSMISRITTSFKRMLNSADSQTTRRGSAGAKTKIQDQRQQVRTKRLSG